MDIVSSDGHIPGGWPHTIQDEVFYASPIVYDIDRSGTEDIILVNSNAEIHVLHVPLVPSLSPRFHRSKRFNSPRFTRFPTCPSTASGSSSPRTPRAPTTSPPSSFLFPPHPSFEYQSARLLQPTDAKRFQHRRCHAAAQNSQSKTPPTRKTHLHRTRSTHSSQCRAFHRRRTTRLDAPRLLLSQRTRLPRGNPGNRPRKVDLSGNCNADTSPAASPRWI